MGRRKIAFITSSPITVLVFLTNHIKCLSLDYEVYVITNFIGTNEKGNLTIKIDENAYRDIEKFANVISLGITRRITIINDIKTIISLWKIFRKVKFSSVHSITSKVGIIVMISAFLAGVKNRFHTYTGQVWATKKGVKRFFFKFIDKIIAILATNCYADSRSQMEFLVNEKVMRKNKISVLGTGSISGVNTSRFFPDAEMRYRMRKSLSIPNNDIVFLLLGRIKREKGVLDIAKAFSQLVKENNCCLLIVGPDEELLISQIKSIIGTYYSSKLIFVGYTNSQEKYINASDVLCLPSYREGFGSVIIEAAAVGIPAIGSDIYGICDAIVNGVTGILHKVGDVSEIYKAMHRLTSDQLLRKNMGEKALIRVNSNFTMEKISMAWLKEYNEKIKIED